MTRPNDQNPTLPQQVTHFYDEFVQLAESLAFFCNAMACLSAEENSFDVSTVQGVSHTARWLKQRCQMLKQELKIIHERVCADETH